MTSKRRRFKQTRSLGERLTDEAMRLRSKAKAVPPLANPAEGGRQDEAVAHLTEWLMSPSSAGANIGRP
ncbi:hypothetical protein ACVWZM_000267 [Bradyrhizobium sp. USDA 4501]|nr:hypothetical protein [Bradyrhizobium sp. USDA 4541]